MLCVFCETLNFDAACSKQGAEHNQSWLKVCASAEAGCKLCTYICARRYAMGDPCGSKPYEALTADDKVRCFYDQDNSWLFWACVTLGAVNRISSIHICTANDDPLSKLIWSRQPPSDTRSDAFFSQLHNWIQTCLDKHGACRSVSGNVLETLTGHKKREISAATLPTRVIDVGNDDTPPSLCMPQDTHVQWVALSHRWGKHQPLKLESHSIAMLSNAIPLDVMPPLFQDAIFITRRLGFRYLWIDSLCIMQDSRQDWLTESRKMGDIYKNAVFTISAEAARDSTIGILSSAARNRISDADQQVDGIIKIKARSTAHSVEGVFTLVTNSGMKTMPYAQGPLSARKWVLQEELLSYRILRFAEGLVWWECCQLQCNERFPYGVMTTKMVEKNVHIRSSIEWATIRSFTLTSGRGRTHQRGDVLRLVNQRHIEWYWYSTVNEYCSRHMTYDTDSLPAISGIAKEYQRKLFYDSSSYKAGIWLSDLPSGLLWYTPWPGATTAVPYVAPSWSWASIKSGAYYSSRLLDDLIPDDTWINSFAARRKPHAVATIVEINLKTEQQDPFGQVQEGFMKLQGPCSELCRCRIPFRFFDCYTTAEVVVLRYSEIRELLQTTRTRNGQDVTGVCTLSEFTANQSCVQSESITHGPCLVIHLVSTKRLKKDHQVAFVLILEPVEDSGGKYQRTGLAMLLEDVTSSKVWPSKLVTVI